MLWRVRMSEVGRQSSRAKHAVNLTLREVDDNQIRMLVYFFGITD